MYNIQIYIKDIYYRYISWKFSKPKYVPLGNTLHHIQEVAERQTNLFLLGLVISAETVEVADSTEILVFLSDKTFTFRLFWPKFSDKKYTCKIWCKGKYVKYVK